MHKIFTKYWESTAPIWKKARNRQYSKLCHPPIDEQKEQPDVTVLQLIPGLASEITSQ